MPEPSKPEKKNATQLLGILSGKKRRLLPADFMDLVIDRLGGVHKLAEIVASILTDTRNNGMVKQRILTDMTRLMCHVETKSKPPPDLSQFNTEDLKLMLKEVLANLEGGTEGDNGN